MKKILFVVSLLFYVSSYCEEVTSYHSDNLDYGVPAPADIVIDRLGFCNGYNTKTRQPDWCSYRLTKEKVTTKVCGRLPFEPDLKGMNYPVYPNDYTRSGYDRGHIAPAADMAWSYESMSNCFFMSNMSPQVGMFNRGIWRLLEEWVRETAVREESIFVVTGPIFLTNVEHKVTGPKKDIVVPEAYYKVIYDETEPQKMIGFVLNNEPSTNAFRTFVVPVKKVEELTGLNFFSVLPYCIQTNFESKVDLEAWHL